MSDYYDSDGSEFGAGHSPAKPKKAPGKAAAKSGGKATSSSSNGGDSGVRNGQAIESIYQKKTPVEHVLLRPDTYIGSVEPIDEEMWVMDTEVTKRMARRKLHYTPGLYKIVDEILVNAADNKSRDPSMKKIEVTIDKEAGIISIMNDGKGIPIEIHRDEKVYVPELIFGHLLTSSNYNDKQEKTTGGRNGYGAKLCNIFSTEFIVETADSAVQKKYVQTFTDNMKNIGSPKITKYGLKKEYTKITFKPDFGKFHMTHLDDDAIALITKRVYDLAGCVEGVRVSLNGEVIPLKGFKSYVELFLLPPVKQEQGEDEDDMVISKPPEIIYKRFSDRWEVAFAVSDGQFNQVSFVNSINTIRGGTHVNYIADQIVRNFIAANKKSKIDIKPHQVKNNMWLFVNAKIVNPTFDSQTKETLTLRSTAFGSKCEITDDFMRNVLKSELKEFVEMMVRRKEERELKKTDGSRSTRLIGIDKLDDANLAGGKRGRECTLILTEGDSAKTLAVAGLGVQGRDRFGIFTLRGKPLNVRDASNTQISANQEFTHIKHILGLKHGTKYTDTTDLRYGHVLIMTDQDVDGSHIKGLIVNMFDSMYPGLLEVDGFLQQFITPIVRVTHSRTKQRIDFYTEQEFKKWHDEQPNSAKGWVPKYYKGLGTSKESDALEYFTKLDFHRKMFETAEANDRKLLDMAFNKSKADARKEWLAGYKPGEWIDNKKPSVAIGEFINKELVLFSIEDNARSIPSVVDGLKPGQRKILWTCLEANITKEIKVVALQGKVTEKAAYHHGDQSLVATIVNMAQDYVGSNNINLLVPEGSFGTRLLGGKDAASARYISTFLNKIARAIYHKGDDALLETLYDDGKPVEPRWYMPVMPMVLVNGADGIGTGWSTNIPNYNPSEIIDNIRRLMRKEPLVPMMPWYRGFRGAIEPEATGGKFRTCGTIEKISDTELQISELPIRMWTDTYKAMVNKWMSSSEKSGAIIKDYRYNSSTLTVDITLTLTPDQMIKAEQEGLDKRFRLVSNINTTNMVCFDREGRLRRYTSPEEIIEDFYPLRLRYYQLRKENMAEKLGRDLQMADNRVRFVLEIIQKKLVVSNRKRKDLVKELKDRNYTPIPKKAQTVVAGDPESEKAAEAEAEAEEQGQDVGSDFDYLLSMPIWNLTMEKVEKLTKEKKDIELRLEELLARTPIQIWERDLEDVEKLWHEMVVEYQQRLQTDEENRNRQAGGRGKAKGKGKGKAAATARSKTTSTTAAAAAAAKRKPDVAGLDTASTSSVPKVQKTLGFGASGKAGAKSKAGAGGDIKPKVSAAAASSSVSSLAAASNVANLGSDLEDSDDDVTTNIFSKFSAGGGGGGGRTVLGSKATRTSTVKPPTATATASSSKDVSLSRGSGSVAGNKALLGSAGPSAVRKPPAPAKKKIVKKKTIVDSSDDDDDDDVNGGYSDSGSSAGGGGSPPPKRSAPPRRNAASSATSRGYVDISDDSDDGDFAM
ncbi:DNA topoisomerase 2 [Coemansia sp. RSA 2049]|nr:DNA topoisomerase 2 [Coemansia sp. RSA 2049]